MHPPSDPTQLRLLFLSDSPITVSGGSERFLRNLVTGLTCMGFPIRVVHLCDEPPLAEQVHKDAVPANVEIRYVPCRAVYGRSGWRARHTLRQMLVHEGFHVIQSQHENADFINAILPRGRLRAIRISNRRDTGFLKSAKLRFASRFLNHRYDRIVAPTPAILDALETTECIARTRTLCIPNGVDTTRFHPIAADACQNLRTSLGFPPDALLVGCVADLFEVKRHLDLIDAFARLRTEVPSAQLILIGDGPMRGAIEARARAQGVAAWIHLPGSCKDVAARLAAFDLFVLASDTEGLSNAILEAQACGLPVVATKVGGNPDLVDDECGALVPPRAPEELATAMRDLLDAPDLRARMGARARARVERHHSLQAMTHAYAAMYRERAHVQ